LGDDVRVVHAHEDLVVGDFGQAEFFGCGEVDVVDEAVGGVWVLYGVRIWKAWDWKGGRTVFQSKLLNQFVLSKLWTSSYPEIVEAIERVRSKEETEVEETILRSGSCFRLE
jgi:hypothetical protein